MNFSGVGVAHNWTANKQEAATKIYQIFNVGLTGAPNCPMVMLFLVYHLVHISYRSFHLRGLVMCNF